VKPVSAIRNGLVVVHVKRTHSVQFDHAKLPACDRNNNQHTKAVVLAQNSPSKNVGKASDGSSQNKVLETGFLGSVPTHPSIIKPEPVITREQMTPAMTAGSGSVILFPALCASSCVELTMAE
jgi:hypothetical protein